MECKETDCKGTLTDGLCDICGKQLAVKTASNAERNQELTDSIKALLRPDVVESGKEDLVRASQKLASIVPDDYHAWRLQADLLLTAIRQLETRLIEPDESVQIMGTPLRETLLRDAAEEALRNCAHFASTLDERIALVDEANRIRRTTWF